MLPTSRLFIYLSLSIYISNSFLLFFFFNDTATTEIYTLSLHDALPICIYVMARPPPSQGQASSGPSETAPRSEEHTSELQSPDHLVCRLLLEKKKKIRNRMIHNSRTSSIRLLLTH